jgi:hypothetical protein
MAQRDNILQELNELGSTLATASSSTLYHVPAGYFHNLADQVMTRIKALEADTVTGELAILSPLVDTISRTTPYQAPSGYFDGLEKKLMQAVLQNETGMTPREELESLSPLLSSLKKEIPYTIPDGYFEKLQMNGENKKSSPAKVVSMGNTRKWLRYAAAAVVIGFVAVSSFLLLNKEKIDPKENSFEWVKKNMKKVDADDLDQFIDLTQEEVPALATNTPSLEVKELIKNIPADELQDLIDDAQAAEPDSDADILLN